VRKVAGCCSKCDAEVFEVVARDDDRKPARLGPAKENAERLTFYLLNGSRMDLTFCTDCAESLTPGEFPFLWRRVMETWVDEVPGHSWAGTQTTNGIAGLMGRKLWRDVK